MAALFAAHTVPGAPRETTEHMAAFRAMVAGESGVQLTVDRMRGLAYLRIAGKGSAAVRSYSELPTVTDLRRDIAAMRHELRARNQQNARHLAAERAE
jgi:hypothetical protein